MVYPNSDDPVWSSSLAQVYKLCLRGNDFCTRNDLGNIKTVFSDYYDIKKGCNIFEDFFWLHRSVITKPFIAIALLNVNLSISNQLNYIFFLLHLLSTQRGGLLSKSILLLKGFYQQCYIVKYKYTIYFGGKLIFLFSMIKRLKRKSLGEKLDQYVFFSFLYLPFLLKYDFNMTQVEIERMRCGQSITNFRFFSCGGPKHSSQLILTFKKLVQNATLFLS